GMRAMLSAARPHRAKTAGRRRIGHLRLTGQNGANVPRISAGMHEGAVIIATAEQTLRPVVDRFLVRAASNPQPCAEFVEARVLDLDALRLEDRCPAGPAAR